MCSFLNSLTTELILLPFVPTQVPTGSILSSYDSTATFALTPGSLVIPLIVIKPSNTSGISISNTFSKNLLEVLDNKITMLLFLISTAEIIDLTESPFLKKSEGICSDLGNINSVPSSSKIIT